MVEGRGDCQRVIRRDPERKHAAPAACTAAANAGPFASRTWPGTIGWFDPTSSLPVESTPARGWRWTSGVSTPSPASNPISDARSRVAAGTASDPEVTSVQASARTPNRCRFEDIDERAQLRARHVASLGGMLDRHDSVTARGNRRTRCDARRLAALQFGQGLRARRDVPDDLQPHWWPWQR